MLISAQSELRRPLHFLRSLLRDIRGSRVLTKQLLLRNLRHSYRQSLLGYVWAFVPPLAIAGAFVLMGRAKVINVGPTELPYTAYVVFNMAIWQTFLEALNAPIVAVLNSRPILTRIRFPREALLFAKFAEVAINFGIKLVLIAATLAWFGVAIKPTAPLALLAVLALILFGAFVGLLLAPLAALYQDVSKALPLVGLFWMLMTPVVFPVPDAGFFAQIVQANPVTPLLVTVRELATSDTLTSLRACIVFSVLAVVGTVAGMLVFRLAMPYIAERIPS